MSFGVPVVAVNNGGPTESIVNRETGFLADNTHDAFTGAIARFLLMDPEERKQMGADGRKRAHDLFSLQHFGDIIDEVATNLVAEKKERKKAKRTKTL